MNTENFTESVGTVKLRKKIRELSEDGSVKRMWNTRRGKLTRNVYESSKVTDSDFDKICSYFKGMKNSSSYREYKKYFDNLCRMCMMSPEGLIIQTYKLRKGKGNDNNYVCITYSNTRQKITIPAGSRLYHTTTYVDETIKELKPTYQGKAAKGYLYSTPRVYLTIRKQMPKIYADIGHKQKTRMYVVKENIRTAYVDPLVPGYKCGAVYVETKFPIPVEEVKPMKKEEIKKESVETEMMTGVEVVEEDVSFASLEEFCEYYGLEIVDDEDEVIKESFSAEVGKVARSMDAKKYFKNIWENLSSKIQHKALEKKFGDKEYAELKKNFEVLKSSKDYNSYRKAYEKICKTFGLVAPNTTIKEIKFYERDGAHCAQIHYHVGKKKILIPNGTQLIHTTKVKGLKELKPAFCSKKSGYYMWPTRRVYFTLGKKIDDAHVGIKKGDGGSYHYTPTETLKTAYIDAELPTYKMGAVFIDTQFPIKVKNIDKPDNK